MPPSTPHHFLGFMMGATYRGVSNQFARVLKPYDITPEQWSVLFMISSHDGINQKEVADAVTKDQPTTARIVELLQRKGFVTKSTSPSDRRAFLLHATEQGTALIATTLPLEQANITEATTGICPEQLEELRAMLDIIYHNTRNMHQE